MASAVQSAAHLFQMFTDFANPLTGGTIYLASVQDASCLFSLIGQSTAILWKDWPKDMKAVGHDPNGHFTLSGTCPHSGCNRPSVFARVVSGNVGVVATNQRGQNTYRWVSVLKCQGCEKYVMGIADQQPNSLTYTYIEHYPMGSPDETVAEEIPDHIKEDFKEALRCLWVKAYNATAEMCRRALEASCLDLGAPKKDVLEDMIDWLEEKRKITPDLKRAAHKVRLGGNRGAHPPGDGPQPAPDEPTPTEPTVTGRVEKILEEHAKAIVEFTRHFFQYVYVIPKQLDKYDFSRPKAITK